MPTTIIDRTIMKPFVALTPRWLKPNQITAFRLALTPVILWLLISGNYGGAGAVFALAALTDALDGAVARTREQVTALGKIFDPLTDKILIVATGSVMLLKFLPSWIFLAVLLVESVTVILALTVKFKRGVEVKANIFGKLKMLLECFGLIGLFIYAAVFPAAALVSLAFYLFFAAVALSICSLFYGQATI